MPPPLRDEQGASVSRPSGTFYGQGVNDAAQGPTDSELPNAQSAGRVDNSDAPHPLPVGLATLNISHSGRHGSDTRVRFSETLTQNTTSNADIISKDQKENAALKPAASATKVDKHVQTWPIDRSPAPPSRSPRQTRDRGYSLRRTLFARNFHGKTIEDDVVLELEPAESSTAAHGSLDLHVNPSKHEKDQRNVTVSPIVVGEEIAGPIKIHDNGAMLPKRRHHSMAIPPLCRKLCGDLYQSYRKIKRRVGKMNKLPPTSSGRHIDFGEASIDTLVDERTGMPYVSNVICSCRYTALNFVPRQLLAQFSKLANFYFLTVSILQMIPGLSTTGTYTTIIPLMIFVGISMTKEGYDDIRRHRLDKEENNRLALVLDQSHKLTTSTDPWKSVLWRDVKVGDVVLLKRNDPVPADIILLYAQGRDRSAYIETMALDGETNLKSKNALPKVAEACGTAEAITIFQARFTVEDPNIDLYQFDGKVTLDSERYPLTNGEIIYRGSVLRNTPAATGLVMYTGEECKIRMNANNNPRIKAPSLQAIVNKVVIIVVVLVLSLAIFNSVAYEVWSAKVESRSWYLKYAKVAFGPIFTSFLIMFNTMIPLSLYVSLEIIKLAQIFLMNDIDMYDEASDTPMEARTSTINEELGQVNYIFSDKTGTLTDNSMLFRKMSFAGTSWLHDHDLSDEASQNPGKEKLLHKKRSGKEKTAIPRKNEFITSSINDSLPSGPSKCGYKSSANDLARPSAGSSAWQSSAMPSSSLFIGRSEEMLEYIQRRPHTVFARKARLMMLSLALCHTCMPEKDDEGNVTFQAASPDELALVMAAQNFGYIVINRDSSSITIQIDSFEIEEDGTYEKYEILDVIEFSSVRRRMSIIVRMPDSRICIFSKGADSTMTGLLRQSDLAGEYVAAIEQQNNRRKSMEAQEVLRRKSVQLGRKGSVARGSISLPGASHGPLRRTSSSLGRKHSIRESIDHWLKDRETDVNMRNPRTSTQFYSPRLSGAAFSPRMTSHRGSLTGNDEARLASHMDVEEDLVDEALVVNDQIVLERTLQHINDFATEGLRTLMYGYRYIGDEEYQAWKQVYVNASTNLAGRQELIEKAAEMIETQFELVGATAIEDKLQKGVPETIDRLRRAGIKLWMLTGDKRETAINIGHSCRLVKDYSMVVILDHETGEVDHRMKMALANLKKEQIAHTVVVVDGQTLSLIDAEAEVKRLFLELAISADSVICCRASPSQKASLVRAIRTKVRGSVTLAIGDGANDIAMIQEAHIGIGITGKEGLQAARSSDYSIAQFRFLLKLLLVHGRWNYIRTCKYTLGTFWKESMFYLTQALYQRYNGYTGTSFYEPWSLSMFNTLFTSLPVIFMGVFEKDLAASTLLAAPELYNKGQRNGGFNIPLYFWWLFLAASDAMIIFFTAHGLFGDALFTEDNSLFATGALAFTACITVISLKLQFLELHNRSVAAAIAILLSVGGWYLWNSALSAIYPRNVIYDVHGGFLGHFGRNLLWWLTLIVAVLAVCLFEVTISTTRNVLRPTDVDIFQAYEQDLEVRKRFEEAAADYLQQGWDRGSKKSSFELAREAAVEAEREAQVRELLNRPRAMTHERPGGSEIRKRFSWTREDGNIVETGKYEMRERKENNRNKSLDAAELFSKGFGVVQKGPDLR